MSPITLQQLADLHIADLRQEACRARLAKAARRPRRRK